ncbi:PREDICTED: protection of telomeres protein 1b-like isoform X2 [Camelina sativa]|uniref:Protection of telomeres protein 1b-like isoform X2 n=1 Tax=Camelina sativa TaxID=90675 RepID=A0ABM0XUG4_CAMSA|nr:PREDICTED: protection of telomeres protein 1b-like isoform X2 [Camelina sativa]
MEIRDDYKFLRIQDAFKALHLHINLIGVIVELGFSTGSGSGLPVKFVARITQTLPRVESIGDIILLSRVKIVLINRKITALCNETSSSSTFALFHGKHGVDFVPYQSLPKFLIREQDKSFLSNLREWLITYKFEDGSCCFTPLKDIKEGECSNLSCLIVHISKVYKDRWYIYVWDGTELPPCNILVKSERLPLCVEPEMLPTYILRKFPTFGSVLRIIVDRVSEKQAIHCLQPGQHVKFLNIFFQVNMGLWNATFTPSTKMQYTMNREMQGFSPQSMSGEKFSSTWNPITRCISHSHSGITGVAHEDAPFVSLMDILTYHSVTAKFRCVVRFIQVYPRDVRKLRDSNGKFKLLAILEDATARIHASLYADEGEKFFGCDQSDEEAIVKKMNRLLGGEEMEQVPRNPPWVQCCLFSFYKHKMDQWGSRRFRIFDTWINAS